MKRYKPRFIGYRITYHTSFAYELFPVFIMKNIIDRYEYFDSNGVGANNYPDYSTCIKCAQDFMRSSFKEYVEHSKEGKNQS